MTKVFIRHIRAIELPGGKRLCAPGTRQWFRNHGFDWNDFLFNGIDADKLTATGDHWALKAVANAEKEEADNGR